MTQLLGIVEKTKNLNKNVEDFMALNPEEICIIDLDILVK